MIVQILSYMYCIYCNTRCKVKQAIISTAALMNIIILLQDREDGPLYKFYEVIRDTEGDFMDRITRMRDLTLFAPSNNAWLDSNLNNLVRDRSKIKEILNMHLVEQRLTMEHIIQSNTNQVMHKIS